MSKKTKQDPTGQAARRRRAAAAIHRRLALAESEVKRLFRAIPRKRRQETVVTNDTAAVYTYEQTAEQQEQFEQQLAEVVALAILSNRRGTLREWWAGVTAQPEIWLPAAQNRPRLWWFAQDYIEPAYRQGTVDEVSSFNLLIIAALAAGATGVRVQTLDVGDVFRSSEYRDALEKVYVRNFGALSTLSQRTSDQLRRVINAGMAAGDTPATIRDRIIKRFGVARSSATRIAVTEINQAYTDARMDASDIAALRTGLRAAVVHISALLPTTRDTHAARHLKRYTTAAQRKWWNSGANRINCHCSVLSVLLDSQGNIVD